LLCVAIVMLALLEVADLDVFFPFPFALVAFLTGFGILFLLRAFPRMRRSDGLTGHALAAALRPSLAVLLLALGTLLWDASLGGTLPVGAVPAAVSLSGVIDIAAGSNHSCALLDTGAAVCWGDDTYGQSSPPDRVGFSPRGPASATPGQISAGDRHTCAIAQGTGAAVCWGDNSRGQLAVPAGFAFVELSAGGYHTCGITNTGHIRCWGSNSHGQSTQPVGNFLHVSSGLYHTCAIRGDAFGLEGTVDCWGSNSHGQGMDPPVIKIRLLPPFDPVETETVRTFTQIGAGAFHNCGIQTSGMVFCWGDDSLGQLSLALPNAAASNVSLASGATYSCVVYALSPPGLGNWWLDCAGNTPANYPASIAGPSGAAVYEVYSLSAGTHHVCALVRVEETSAFGALCWGDNSSGQSRVPSPPRNHSGGDVSLPESVPEGTPITLDATGQYTDPDQSAASLTYNWSIEPLNTTAKTYDDATGLKVTFPAQDGPSTLNFGVQAVDDDGLSAYGYYGQVQVTNIPPSISSLTSDGPGTPGQPVTIDVTASDPAGADDPLTYEYDCDGDGTYEIGPLSTPSAECSFEAPGSYVVKVLVSDDDGGTATGQTEVLVASAPTVASSPTATSAPFSSATASAANATASDGSPVSASGSGETPGLTVDSTPEIDRQASAGLEGETPSARIDTASEIDSGDAEITSTAATDSGDNGSSGLMTFLLGLLAGAVGALVVAAVVFRRKVGAVIRRSRDSPP